MLDNAELFCNLGPCIFVVPARAPRIYESIAAPANPAAVVIANNAKEPPPVSGASAIAAAVNIIVAISNPILSKFRGI